MVALEGGGCPVSAHIPHHFPAYTYIVCSPSTVSSKITHSRQAPDPWLQVLQSSANSFTNLLLQLWKNEKWVHKWNYNMNVFTWLNVKTWNTKKMIERPHFIFCSKWPWPTNLVFYIISSFLSSCTKQSYLQQSTHQGRKERDIVFREIINTIETRPMSPTVVFCSGVYYTRDNTYKDCYIRHECSQ